MAAIIGDIINWVFTVGFVVWGIQLIRGRLLNTIAGNNFVTKDQYNDPRQRGLGKRVGAVMICAGTMSGFISLAIIFKRFGSTDLYAIFMTLMYISIAVLVVLMVIVLRWSFKNFK